MSLYYHTTKRRLRPHRAPHSTRAKITRLASRQDGLCYLSASGDDHQGTALGRLAPPRAVLPGALYVAQRAEFESRIVDSRWRFQSRSIVASLIVAHSSTTLPSMRPSSCLASGESPRGGAVVGAMSITSRYPNIFFAKKIPEAGLILPFCM